MDARATARQGKTLMVFTIVTIIFVSPFCGSPMPTYRADQLTCGVNTQLPLSFFAAFFAIEITEFRRDEGGTLGLGYISAIMCECPHLNLIRPAGVWCILTLTRRAVPLSTVITAFLIFLAFKIRDLENAWRERRARRVSAKDKALMRASERGASTGRNAGRGSLVWVVSPARLGSEKPPGAGGQDGPTTPTAGARAAEPQGKAPANANTDVEAQRDVRA